MNSMRVPLYVYNVSFNSPTVSVVSTRSSSTLWSFKFECVTDTAHTEASLVQSDQRARQHEQANYLGPFLQQDVSLVLESRMHELQSLLQHRS